MPQKLHKTLDLSRRQTTTQSTNNNSWVILSNQVFDKYAYDVEETPKWKTGKLAIRYKASSVVFNVAMHMLLDGNIEQASLETTEVVPDAVDTLGSYDFAVSIDLERPRAGHVHACAANINVISNKPKHGVASGSDALDIAVKLCELLHCASITLYDAATIHCDTPKDSEHVQYSLRAARILAKGAGWYESKGFRSLVESLDPGVHRSLIPQLHRLSTTRVIAALEKIDATLRNALLNRNYGGITFSSYMLWKGEPIMIDRTTTKDVMEAMSCTSVALDILSAPMPVVLKTLGEHVNYLMKTDCTRAAQLVAALLPHGGRFLVLTGTQLPALAAWVYAWRLVNSNTSRTLALRLGKS